MLGSLTSRDMSRNSPSKQTLPLFIIEMTAERRPLAIHSSSPHTMNSEESERLRNLLAGETFTLSSSVLDYQYENGRRYHAFRQGTCLSK